MTTNPATPDDPTERNRLMICSADFSDLGDRGPCPHTLHDWPLPAGYIDAAEMANSRLAHGWSNTRCPDCGLYGWTPGQFKGTAAASQRVEHTAGER